MGREWEEKLVEADNGCSDAADPFQSEHGSEGHFIASTTSTTYIYAITSTLLASNRAACQRSGSIEIH